MTNQFSGSEKAALGLAATSGSVNLTTGIIDKFSGIVKNADVVNFGKSVTRKFGLVGVGMTTYNSFSDGSFTVGDGARIFMSGVTPNWRQSSRPALWVSETGAGFKQSIFLNYNLFSTR